ncbi:hypothetical protein GW17_00052340 [Ensete ventricosum]|nr:hypothetical protein GW17_00052340 [Ensete ventricosum]
MAGPPVGAVCHGLATCKGAPAMARPPTRDGRLQGPQPARGGHPQAWLDAASPQGRTLAASPQGPSDSGQPYRQQGRQCRSQEWPPLGRATASR